MKAILKVARAAIASVGRRRSARRMLELDIEISHDIEWARHRREQVPLCIATKHIRS
ncbi:MAG TPA: hypothetical protein VNT28_10090 [Candidatus Limnocylindrales bacterium]|jgi:hypothetical protein|nr:hypothetical protein [Candidatus Limnocylindrales bacterium]